MRNPHIQVVQSQPFETRIENTVIAGKTVILYTGEADPGTDPSTGNMWRISKMLYDANGNMIGRTWADNDANFNKKWTDRATYSYRST